MTEIIILAFSAFFIALLGTRWVIFALKERVSSPDIDLLMGKKTPLPLADAGIALTFALIICLLGADVSYLTIAPVFFLAGLALLKKHLKVRKAIEVIIWVISVAFALAYFSMPTLYKAIVGAFWILLINASAKLEKTEAMLPIYIISIGLGISIICVLGENFPSPLAEQSLILAAAGFGFLWWNMHPAKVFPGEIGAIPAVFVAGYLLIYSGAAYIPSALILPAYLFAYKNCAHKIADIWYHRLVAGVNMLLIMLAALAFLNPDISWFNVAVAYVMVFGIEFFLSRKPS